MAKALVIKNADFSANKVTTVTFNDIACTGVEFDSSSVTLSDLGEATVGYTITPSNTTDSVTLTSSNPSVLSVSGTTLTVVGIGTCTLTLSCGGHTAICTVTVDIYEDSMYVASFLSTAIDNSTNYVGACISGSSKRITTVKLLSDTNFSRAFANISEQGIIPLNDYAPIPIPENTTSIHVEATNLYNGEGSFILFYSDTDTTFVTGENTYIQALSKLELQRSTTGGVTSVDSDIVIPEGAKGYTIQLRQHPDYNTIFNNCVTEADVKAIVDNTFHVSVHYLSA